MAPKPSNAQGYPPEMAVAARQMCLFVATILGDLLDDIVVVGGLVPSLIIDQQEVTEGHVGTRDLDLGLSLEVLDSERYHQIADRLRGAGFTPAKNEAGQPMRQTWRLPEQAITVDFLIAPASPSRRPGKLQDLEADFAAFITPALPLAFQDALRVVIDDTTPKNERARREVNVAGPAAFVVLKAHALRLRGENKDAYDLVYVLTQFGEEPVAEVAKRFAAISSAAEAQEALNILDEDFASINHMGPRRYAAFLGGGEDAARRADAYASVREFLRLLRS